MDWDQLALIEATVGAVGTSVNSYGEASRLSSVELLNLLLGGTGGLIHWQRPFTPDTSHRRSRWNRLTLESLIKENLIFYS